eukprot:gene21287-biopygen2642
MSGVGAPAVRPRPVARARKSPPWPPACAYTGSCVLHAPSCDAPVTFRAADLTTYQLT